MNTVLFLIVLITIVMAGMLVVVIKADKVVRTGVFCFGFIAIAFLGAEIVNLSQQAASYYHRYAFQDLLTVIDDGLQRNEIEHVKSVLSELRGDGRFQVITMEEISGAESKLTELMEENVSVEP